MWRTMPSPYSACGSQITFCVRGSGQASRACGVPAGRRHKRPVPVPAAPPLGPACLDPQHASKARFRLLLRQAGVAPWIEHALCDGEQRPVTGRGGGAGGAAQRASGRQGTYAAACRSEARQRSTQAAAGAPLSVGLQHAALNHQVTAERLQAGSLRHGRRGRGHGGEDAARQVACSGAAAGASDSTLSLPAEFLWPPRRPGRTAQTARPRN